MATSNGFVFALCLALLTAMAAATQFRVGGSAGWTVPSDPDTMPYSRWAQRNRLRIGDSLLFVYQPGTDSVLQVSQDAYDTCNVSAPVGRYDDGNTVFTLDRSGPFHFISGDEKNCLKNEKLVVVVLADRSNRVSTATPPSPPPTSSPSPTTAPSPPPTMTPSSLSPSPSPQPTTAPSPPPTMTPSTSSPSLQPTTAPSPPPTPSLQPTTAPSPPPTMTPSSSSPSPQPTTAPSPPTAPSSSSPPPTPASASPSEITPSPSPPTNGASLKVVGFMGVVGALLASVLVM